MKIENFLNFLFFSLIVQLSAVLSNPQYNLWYSRSAEKWAEALPIGDDRLGAMIYGGVNEAIIQMNEDSIYSGKYQNAENPKFYEGLQEVKALFATGDYEKAHEVAEAKLVCKGADHIIVQQRTVIMAPIKHWAILF